MSEHPKSLHPFFTLALAIAIGCLSPIAIAVPASENAALRYWRAIWLMGEDQLSPVTVYDGPYQPEYNHAEEGEPPYTSSQLLADNAETIELLIEASDFADCDFGIDYHKGVDALLPQLSPMRKATQLIVLDAKRLLAEGDVNGATERLAAGYRMAEHITGDSTLINSLVSVACFALVDSVVTEHAGAFSDANRRTIAAALARFEADDPFGCERAIRGEARLFGDWMMQRIESEWSSPEAFGKEVELLFDEGGAAEFIALVYTGPMDDHEAFRNALRNGVKQYTTAVHLMADAWNMPEAEKSLEAIEVKITDGAFGPVARLMAPALTRAHRNDMKTRSALTARLEWATN